MCVWSTKLFKSARSSLIFRLDVLFIVESEALKSTMTAPLSSSPFRSVNICFRYASIFMLGAFQALITVLSPC